MPQTKAELKDERDALLADLAIIANTLRSEAEDRSWCSEYGTVMESINSQTSKPWMRECRSQTVEGSVTIDFSDLKLELQQDESREDALYRWMQDNLIGQHYSMDSAHSVTFTEG